MITKENKELLLKDLCARLPYGIFVKENRKSLDDSPIIYTYDYHPYIDDCKPYLRPMSSMTEKDKADLEAYSKQELDKYEDNILNRADKDTIRYSRIALIYKDIDWYNKNYFDYRCLIPMGLALEAPKDMYKF